MKRAALIVVCVAAPACAQVIDFETLPGGATPADNQPLPRDTPYVVDGIEVRIGFDTNGDGIADTDAMFEASGEDGTDGYNVCFQANDTARSGLDAQLGDRFLRWVQPVQSLASLPPPIVISYSAPSQAFSGEVWDLDAGTTSFEQWRVQAFDASGVLVAQVDSPVMEPGCNGDTFDGEPWVFAVSAVDIRKVVLSFIGSAPSVGLAFNNFRSNSFLPGPTLIARTPDAFEGVERGPGEISTVRLVWSEPVDIDPGDLVVTDDQGSPVPHAFSGSGTQVTTISFAPGEGIRNGEHTITVRDTAVASGNNAPIDGDGNGLAGGALVLPIRHACNANLATPYSILDLRDINAFVESFLNSCD